MIYLLSILILPILASIIVNIYRSKITIVRYVPILCSVISLLIISLFTYLQYFSSSQVFNPQIMLYQLFPTLGISMSFITNKISIALLFLANITIITALYSTLKTEKRLNEINTLILLISVGIYGLILADDLFVFFLFMR